MEEASNGNASSAILDAEVSLEAREHGTSENRTVGTINDGWQDISLAVFLCLLIAITVVGNTLIIVAVATTRRLRTVTNCFVMSLAVADWLVGLFVMPPAVAYRIMGSWELGWILCDIWISLDVLLCTASILSLCAISIDRYLAVTQPLNYSRRRRSKRLALFMILIVWLAALAITCPPMLGWYEFGRHENKECRYNKNKGYVVFSAMGSFFLPLVVMVYVYTRISCVVSQRHNQLTCHDGKQRKSVKLVGGPEESDLDRGLSSECEEGHLGVTRCTSLPSDVMHYTNNHQHLSTRSIRSHYTAYCGTSPCKDHKNQLQQHQHANPFPPPVNNYYGRSSRAETLPLDQQHSLEQQQQQHHHHPHNNHSPMPTVETSSRVSSFRRESKTAQTLSIVVGGFIACWLPFFVSYLLNPFHEVPPWLVECFTWLGWINSAINPFIYAFYSPDFRLAFWRLTFRNCSGPRRPTDPAFGLK